MQKGESSQNAIFFTTTLSELLNSSCKHKEREPLVIVLEYLCSDKCLGKLSAFSFSISPPYRTSSGNTWCYCMKERCLWEENLKTFMRCSSTQKHFQAEFKGDCVFLLIFLVTSPHTNSRFCGRHKSSVCFMGKHTGLHPQTQPKGPHPWEVGWLSIPTVEPLAFSCHGCVVEELRTVYLRRKWRYLLTLLSRSSSLQSETCCVTNSERQPVFNYLLSNALLMSHWMTW